MKTCTECERDSDHPIKISGREMEDVFLCPSCFNEFCRNNGIEIRVDKGSKVIFMETDEIGH
jgi:hypothetical protein